MVHTSPWDLAIESVEEALRSGAVPSLDRLGRLGQLGNLPALVEALREEHDAALVAIAHARERESLGFSSREVAAELLALGRVLERRGERTARDGLDWCLLLYFERVTDDLADRARRDPLTGLLNHQAFPAAVAREAARARRYRGRVALVLFELDNFKETSDTEGHQEGERLSAPSRRLSPTTSARTIVWDASAATSSRRSSFRPTQDRWTPSSIG
jgi:GGDEF domain-containing protein